SNVCSKCGVHVDEVTADIFFARRIKLESSYDKLNKSGATEKDNPYFNATYMYAPNKRGVRIFKSLFFSNDRDTDTFWIEANRPILTLDMFLDQLNGLFNANWRIVNNIQGQPTLYFWRKDNFISSDIL